jgi:hypothetical protein
MVWSARNIQPCHCGMTSSPWPCHKQASPWPGNPSSCADQTGQVACTHANGSRPALGRHSAIRYVSDGRTWTRDVLLARLARPWPILNLAPLTCVAVSYSRLCRLPAHGTARQGYRNRTRPPQSSTSSPPPHHHAVSGVDPARSVLVRPRSPAIPKSGLPLAGSTFGVG